AVDHGAVTPADATLIVDVYAPAAGEPGGAEAATRHGLTWPAARQRCSRAVRRIAAAVRADVPACRRVRLGPPLLSPASMPLCARTCFRRHRCRSAPND